MATNPTGLRILKTGCQVVNGNQALALVRSRNLQYEVKGVWYDYGSDFTRIRNQQAFFRAVIHQLNAEITNPIAVTGFINAAVHNLTIDQTLSEGTMFNLAREFHGFPPGSLKAVTFPTVGPYITSGGADVSSPAAAADDVVMKNFLSFGATAPTAPTTSSTATTASATSAGAAAGLIWTAILASATSTTTTTATTTSNQTTVTTIAPIPSGEAPIYNNAPAPWTPRPAEAACADPKPRVQADHSDLVDAELPSGRARRAGRGPRAMASRNPLEKGQVHRSPVAKGHTRAPRPGASQPGPGSALRSQSLRSPDTGRRSFGRGQESLWHRYPRHGDCQLPMP